MAIKVQVKENGTSKVQPNFFNNGASVGIGNYDYVGVQPVNTTGFGTWTTPASNAWNNPFTGINTMNNSMNTTPAFINTTPLPCARQNAFRGQLPGMWQGDIAAQMINPAVMNPWFSGINAPMATFTNVNGLCYSTVNSLPVASTIANPVAAEAFGWNMMAAPQQMAATSRPVNAHLAIDVLDNGSQYLLVADLPGVKIDDLELSVENGLLMIKAISQATAFVPGVDMTTPVATISREKAPVKVYERAFSLGRDITIENISASLSNGVLTISLPKVNLTTVTPSRIRNTVVAA